MVAARESIRQRIGVLTRHKNAANSFPLAAFSATLLRLKITKLFLTRSRSIVNALPSEPLYQFQVSQASTMLRTQANNLQSLDVSVVPVWSAGTQVYMNVSGSSFNGGIIDVTGGE